MQKIYTPKKNCKENENETSGPKEKSIDFIKQFARIYSYRPMAQPELGGFIAN